MNSLKYQYIKAHEKLIGKTRKQIQRFYYGMYYHDLDSDPCQVMTMEGHGIYYLNQFLQLVKQYREGAQI